MTTVLALESGRSQDVFSTSTSTMDSLSYVDPLSDKEKDLAEALIDEEMKRSTKRPADYLRGMDPIPTLRFAEHPILQAEFKRIAERRPMATMDVSRYELPEPSLQQRNDPAAWRAAANNAAAQLEQQVNRIVNLELALKHAPEAWRAHNARTSALIKQVEDALEAASSATLQANQRRKLRQSSVAPELARAANDYAAITAKNIEIEVACQLVEDELSLLQRTIEERVNSSAAASGGGTAAPAAAEVGGDGAVAGNGTLSGGASDSVVLVSGDDAAMDEGEQEGNGAGGAGGESAGGPPGGTVANGVAESVASVGTAATAAVDDAVGGDRGQEQGSNV